MKSKLLSRHRRGKKTSERIKAGDRLRMCVHRTPLHTYVQIIEHDAGNSRVLAAASTLEPVIKSKLASHSGNITSASVVGEVIAERAKEKGIDTVAFDRRGNKYHGRIKALVESARKNGLNV